MLSLDLTSGKGATVKAETDGEFAAEVEKLIAERTKARAEKDWATADAIRDKLKDMNVVVKDTKTALSGTLKINICNN